MIKFKQKKFTLAEGHYTGPKDQDKVPGALEVVGKSALGGALAGSAVGAMLKDSTAIEGAITGGKWGAVAGAVFKFFLNYLHNPMTRVKYQDVDKVIRREFGIYRASGVTVGDTISKRANLDEKFAFNDRNVTNYKISFSVQNDQVTMYTFRLSEKELETVDKILDYYCKKYVGMEYAATLINKKYNAYSVIIVFTNYQVISNFIMELSNALETRINLLDNKALVHTRISEYDEEEKTFSAIGTNNLVKILGKRVLGSATNVISLGFLRDIKEAASSIVMGMITNEAAKEGMEVLARAGMSMPREAYNNEFLKDLLKKLHYVESIHYSVGKKNVNANISMISGRLVITVLKGEDQKKLDKDLWSHYKTQMTRTDTGKNNVIIYSYLINSKKELENIIRKMMSIDIMFNVFE